MRLQINHYFQLPSKIIRKNVYKIEVKPEISLPMLNEVYMNAFAYASDTLGQALQEIISGYHAGENNICQITK